HWITFGTNKEVPCAHEHVLSGCRVKHWGRLNLESEVAIIGDLTDNLHPFGVTGFISGKSDSLAERVAREKPLRKLLVDDDDARRVCRVAIVKISASEESNAEDFEVSRRDGMICDGRTGDIRLHRQLIVGRSIDVKMTHHIISSEQGKSEG